MEQPVVTVGPGSARGGGAARALVAGTAAAVLAVGLVAVAVGRGEEGGTPPPLPLLAGAGAATEARAAADTMLAAAVEYRLAGALPDLGDRAPVWRVEAPVGPADAARRVAAALGTGGEVRERDGVATLTGGGVEVSVYAGGGALYVSAYPAPSVAATGGAAGSAPAAGDEPAAADAKERSLPPAPGEGGLEPEPLPVPGPEPVPVPPSDLPDGARAERIARDLLRTIGVGGEWTAEVIDGATTAVASDCPPEARCAAPEPVVSSRSVVLRALAGGRTVSGLEWYVEVGDRGVVQSVGGTWAALEPVGDYPLRPVTEAYDDLVAGRGFAGDVAALAAAADGDARGGAGGAAEPTPAVEPLPAPVPGPAPEPVRVTVTVTGATLGASLVAAFEDGAEGAYVVPTYRFEGSSDAGGPWSAEVLALAPAAVATPTTTAPASTAAPTVPVAPEPVAPPSEPGPGPEPVVPAEDGDLVLYVSNQSFEVDPVDLEVAIDGVTVVAQDFAVGSQHTWVPFGFALDDGAHLVTVVSARGAAEASFDVTTGAAPRHLVISYWGPGEIGVTAHDSRPAFD
ncbi:MAG: hypothetical protein KatS3mg009_3222 [Acidimicrobiia bacterium]|nr:MAG: hypothetical protein KatS3mg009_3222 [Acidimicrobiia bacterium]